MRNIWKKFIEAYDDKKLDSMGTTPKSNPAFIKFLEDYKEFDKRLRDVDESMTVAYDIMRNLFESQDISDCVEAIFEDDPPKKPLSAADMEKLRGGIEAAVLDIALKTINDHKNKVKFSGSKDKNNMTGGMARFARVEIGLVENIEDTYAFKEYGLNREGVAAAVEKAKKENYTYFIMAYFKIPKEIDDREIKGKKKKK